MSSSRENGQNKRSRQDKRLTPRPGKLGPKGLQPELASRRALSARELEARRADQERGELMAKSKPTAAKKRKAKASAEGLEALAQSQARMAGDSRLPSGQRNRARDALVGTRKRLKAARRRAG